MDQRFYNPTADACFVVRGDSLPLDHGYMLFSTLSKMVPALHQKAGWGMHTIAGRQRRPGLLDLDGKSTLRIRLPSSDVGRLFPLIGASLEVSRHAIELGEMSLQPLTPVASVWSKIVTVRGYTEPQAFLTQLREQLAALPDLGQPVDSLELVVVHRKIMKIKNQTIVGFRTEIHGLEAKASLRLQELGLGGRRHMGAGLFIPIRKRCL